MIIKYLLSYKIEKRKMISYRIEQRKRLFPILSLPLYAPLTAVCHTSFFFFFSFFILKVDYFIRRKGDMWLITNGRA